MNSSDLKTNTKATLLEANRLFEGILKKSRGTLWFYSGSVQNGLLEFTLLQAHIAKTYSLASTSIIVAHFEHGELVSETIYHDGNRDLAAAVFMKLSSLCETQLDHSEDAVSARLHALENSIQDHRKHMGKPKAAVFAAYYAAIISTVLLVMALDPFNASQAQKTKGPAFIPAAEIRPVDRDLAKILEQPQFKPSVAAILPDQPKSFLIEEPVSGDVEVINEVEEIPFEAEPEPEAAATVEIDPKENLQSYWLRTQRDGISDIPAPDTFVGTTGSVNLTAPGGGNLKNVEELSSFGLNPSAN
jgi:hypothetical protein